MTIGVVLVILGPLAWLAIEAIRQALDAATGHGPRWNGAGCTGWCAPCPTASRTWCAR